MTQAALRPWSARAINLPEHADNPIHTDAGAKASGYPAAIVAGTSVYAFLTHPPAASWGLDWVTAGGGELRLQRPVFDADLVDCVIEGSADSPTVEAQVGGATKATFAVERVAAALPEREGEHLETFEVILSERWAAYGMRSGDDLSLYATEGIVHPAAWPALANNVFRRYLIDGPWIHTRSRIVHCGRAPAGETAVVASTVVDRFETRAGERALVDVRVFVAGNLVAEIEHEALVRLS